MQAKDLFKQGLVRPEGRPQSPGVAPVLSQQVSSDLTSPKPGSLAAAVGSTREVSTEDMEAETPGATGVRRGGYEGWLGMLVELLQVWHQFQKTKP